MDHLLVQGIEKALGWSGSSALGAQFARGTMPDADVCMRLLTPERLLDVIMRRNLGPPQLRVFRDGDELHPDAYLNRSVTRRGQALSVANMDRLGNDLLPSGCTLVLDALDSMDPTMEVACRALQWWCHEMVQVNVYLTTNQADGFGLHWDDHDVLIVQLAGHKAWEVRGPSRPVPMYRDAEQNTDAPETVLWSGTMRADDVMHIPRGFWHQATRAEQGDGYSLHVTFGIVQRTGVDWLNWVADRSREHEVFRRDLDRWSTAGELAEQQRQLVAGVARLLADYPVATYLAAREQERQPPRHVVTGGVFGRPSAVVCATEFPPHVERDGDAVVVSTAGTRLTFAARAEPVLRALLSGHPVDLAAVTATTGVDAAAVVDVLIREGVCAELTEALSSGFTGMVPAGTCLSTR